MIGARGGGSCATVADTHASKLKNHVAGCFMAGQPYSLCSTAGRISSLRNDQTSARGSVRPRDDQNEIAGRPAFPLPSLAGQNMNVAAMEFAFPKWENRLTVSALMTPRVN